MAPILSLNDSHPNSSMSASALKALSILICIVMTTNAGCTRARYRTAADSQSYNILDEKASFAPWELPADFNIMPDPRSRLYQGGNPDDPMLPTPAPVLYEYTLPAIPERDPARFRGTTGGSLEELPSSDSQRYPNELEYDPSAPLPEGARNLESRDSEASGETQKLEQDLAGELARRFVRGEWGQMERDNYRVAHGPWREVTTHPANPTVELVRYDDEFPMHSSTGSSPVATLGGLRLGMQQAISAKREVIPPQLTQVSTGQATVVHAAGVDQPRDRIVDLNSPSAGLLPPATPIGTESARRSQDEDDTGNADDGQPRVVAVPQTMWGDLPSSCIPRMLEFESIREEYELTFGTPPPPELFDPSPRLALEDIIDLSILNSREYQTQKEVLYRAALRLSLERFQYDLKFATGGHSTDANYLHSRNGGVTVNSLAVPTDVTVDKALVTGGDLLARFANDVVLTFNGPTGFSVDVGSTLLLSLSQSLLQRDVILESLTQSERDVLYAARDFARFRKSFFVQRASDYYGLILNIRQVEISSQNYISLVRAFNEAEAEFRATGARSRIEVDQLEQNALGGKRTLISTCNTVASQLDRLKIAMGLPPETSLNLSLEELEQLTIRDEITVTAELVQRSRRILSSDRELESPVRAALLNGAGNLIQRMILLLDTRARLGDTTTGTDELKLLLAIIDAEEVLLDVRFNRAILENEKQAEPPAPPLRIYQRSMDLVNSILVLIDLENKRARLAGLDIDELDALETRRMSFVRRFEEISDSLDLTMIREQVELAESLLEDVDALLVDSNRITQRPELTEEVELTETLAIVDMLLESSQEMTQSGNYGLVPVDVEMDEAMLTAIVSRFDLLNQRGELADTWRQIKYAGDDLRSILNLSANQTIRTETNVNRAFDFTWDESATSLGIRFDTPVNRRAQRNNYRQSLINYQAALRGVMALEDAIKVDIRDDLRNLSLRREQYEIDVASAALAYERVVSTQLQLSFNTPGVAARDYLEAQQDYANSLNNVASTHIDYIQLRNQFFLDLEALTVDESGFWQDLYNERVQPEMRFGFDPSTDPPYGRLHPRLRYSRSIRRMEQIPDGQATILEE